jgi:hypothetical protein
MFYEEIIDQFFCLIRIETDSKPEACFAFIYLTVDLAANWQLNFIFDKRNDFNR